MIFQDPLSSLNPIKKVGKQISEIFTILDGRDAAALLHLPDKGEHLGLNGNVQGRGGLVADKD